MFTPKIVATLKSCSRADFAAGQRHEAFLVFVTMARTGLVDLTVAIGLCLALGRALGLALKRRARDAAPIPWTPRKKQGARRLVPRRHSR